MNALADTGGIAGNIFGAFQAGQQARQQADHRNALAQYATNPSEQALAPLAQFDPQFVMGERQRMAQAQQQHVQQQQQQLPMMARLLDHATDPASYAQALQMAQRYGLDVSGAPPQFDPNWVNETKQLVAAVQTPQGQEALSSAGKIAADMGLKPGTPQFNAAVHDIFIAEQSKPYTGAGGETRLYTPRIGGPGQMQGAPVTPPPEAIAELRQSPGTAAHFDEIFGQGAAARILGQGGPAATPGHFPVG